MTIAVKILNEGDRPIRAVMVDRTPEGLKDTHETYVLDPGQEPPKLYVHSGRDIRIEEMTAPAQD